MIAGDSLWWHVSVVCLNVPRVSIRSDWGITRAMGAGQARGIVEEIFELVDPDASGTLTREEYSEMVGHLSKKKDLRNILPKMDHIDTDGDNMVSLKELREFFTKAKLTSKQLVLVKNAIVHSLDDTYANSLYNESTDGDDDEKNSTQQRNHGDSKTSVVPQRRVRSKSPKGSKTNSAAKMQEVGSAAREIVAKGIIWHAQIFADDYHNPKHMNAHGEVRVRRPLPQIRSKDFFQELTYDDKKGSYVFGGGATGLNGWGGLKNLSLVSITYKDKRIMSGRRIVRAWDAYGRAGKQIPSLSSPSVRSTQGKPSNKLLSKPVFPEKAQTHRLSVRATLCAPSWASFGWSPDSPGFCWWYFACRPPARRRVRFGTQMISQFHSDLEREQKRSSLAEIIEPEATVVHQFAHRYALKVGAKEGLKDRIQYHAGILLEWDHGKHCTVIELAWLNGISGYGGKSNWVMDKDTKRVALYRHMPSCMKMPWRQDLAEIRVIDVPCKNKHAFLKYLKKYSGPGLRFIDPSISASSKVRLTQRRQSDIMTYLLNYIRRDGTYNELTRNCQDFAADLYGFLAGVPPEQSKPYHAVCRLTYKQRRHLFLYDP